MKKLFLVLGLVGSLVSGAFAVDSNSCHNYSNQKCYYNPSVAVKYAKDNFEINKRVNYFKVFEDYGGDCTNFVNQAILAGFVGSSTVSTVYSKFAYYQIDVGAHYQWYYSHNNDPSHAWKGANAFLQYVINNSNQNFNGLHLDEITKDSKDKSLEFGKIRLGDVIFADWKGNGTVDHTMIVTTEGSSYSTLRVTYRNATDYSPQKNIALSTINKINTIFHVYRPILYNEGGW